MHGKTRKCLFHRFEFRDFGLSHVSFLCACWLCNEGGEPPPAAGLSNLATWVLKRWSSGIYSATDVQGIAHAAFQDGLRHEEVAKLASLGSWGTHKGNINRDLKAMFVVKNLPKPFVLRVPCKKPRTDDLIYEDCGIILPHEWLSCIGSRPDAEHLLGFACIRGQPELVVLAFCCSCFICPVFFFSLVT